MEKRGREQLERSPQFLPSTSRPPRHQQGRTRRRPSCHLTVSDGHSIEHEAAASTARYPPCTGGRPRRRRLAGWGPPAARAGGRLGVAARAARGGGRRAQWVWCRWRPCGGGHGHDRAAGGGGRARRTPTPHPLRRTLHIGGRCGRRIRLPSESQPGAGAVPAAHTFDALDALLSSVHPFPAPSDIRASSIDDVGDGPVFPSSPTANGGHIGTAALAPLPRVASPTLAGATAMAAAVKCWSTSVWTMRATGRWCPPTFPTSQFPAATM